MENNLYKKNLNELKKLNWDLFCKIRDAETNDVAIIKIKENWFNLIKTVNQKKIHFYTVALQ